MQYEQDQNQDGISDTMTILGRIGAVVCHERGPKADTRVLNTLASNPAEGFWHAIASLNAQDVSATGIRCPLLRMKRREIARLARLLPHPLPAEVPAGDQGPFWAEYCDFWRGISKAHLQHEAKAKRVPA